MNYDLIRRHRLRLAARNEGKIKSYESCVDVRAWSHDTGTRDRYLRDWVKCDMPICVVPACTLASILTIMVCRSRGRVSSRCPPSCTSKLLLDNISSSCSVMKDCLRENKEFDEYFKEEEIETIHWPCDRCLDVLKSIKMFWKVIIEKVLKIEIPRSQTDFKEESSIRSIRSITKAWTKEIIQDAIYVKSASVLFKQNELIKNEHISNYSNKPEIKMEGLYNKYDCKNKSTETDCGVRSIASQKNGKSIHKNISKCTSMNIKMVNKSTDASNKNEKQELKVYKNDAENLRQQVNLQKSEIDRLEKENIILNTELHRIRQQSSKTSHQNSPFIKSVYNTNALIPRGIENDSEESVNIEGAKDIDSELIITLKNCTNKTFKHVSMLQVLHKTNGKKILINENRMCYKDQDPIHLLNKVHKTFGAIVSREMSIAKKTQESPNNDVEIKTTFKNVGGSRSVPSCSTSSFSVTSESNFGSAKDYYDISARSEK